MNNNWTIYFNLKPEDKHNGVVIDGLVQEVSDVNQSPRIHGLSKLSYAELKKYTKGVIEGTYNVKLNNDVYQWSKLIADDPHEILHTMMDAVLKAEYKKGFVLSIKNNKCKISLQYRGMNFKTLFQNIPINNLSNRTHVIAIRRSNVSLALLIDGVVYDEKTIVDDIPFDLFPKKSDITAPKHIKDSLEIIDYPIGTREVENMFLNQLDEYKVEIQKDNPMATWEFIKDWDGGVQDVSKKNNHLSVINDAGIIVDGTKEILPGAKQCATWSKEYPGKFETRLYDRGSFNFPITFEFWLNTDLSVNTSTVFKLVSQLNQTIECNLHETGNILIRYKHGKKFKQLSTSVSVLNPNENYHVVLIMKSVDNIVVYVNNELISFEFNGGFKTLEEYSLHKSTIQIGSDTPCSMSLNYFSVYNKELSPNDILVRYVTGTK